MGLLASLPGAWNGNRSARALSLGLEVDRQQLIAEVEACVAHEPRLSDAGRRVRKGVTNMTGVA